MSSRRRNVKGNFKFAMFGNGGSSWSGKSSKRKLTLTTPDVVRQVNTRELPREQDMYLTEERQFLAHANKR